ncbi:MAG: hypothetical protein JSU98_15495 [Gemmatimonadales bacterium]|nr:MAG: hypothetical protein JSU98_15495 [Gemmatimonadales bacterium]
MRKPALFLPALLLGSLALGGCDADPPRAPGTLVVTVQSPNEAEGGARLVLVGSGMIEATALEGEVHTRVRGDTMGVLVLRPDPGRLRFALQVEDTTRKPRGALVQVVGPDNQVRPALLGYEVEVTR